MESEKVKEIKIALSSIQQLKLQAEGQETPFIILVTSDCLDYINELESENERLTKQYFDWKDLYYENTKRYKKLKDRIAELEKEIKGTPSYAKGYADGIKNTYEAMLPQKLENFAESLKEKADGVCVKNDILYAIMSSDIDETLKEFIK